MSKDSRRKEKFERVTSHFAKNKKPRTVGDAEFLARNVSTNNVEDEAEERDEEGQGEAVAQQGEREERRQTLLDRLSARLQELRAVVPQSTWVFDCNDAALDANKLQQYRTILQTGSGVVVVLNAVARAEIDEIKKSVGECMIEMYGAEHKWEKTVADAVRAGDLYAANPMRNSKNNFGNASFAYLYKQYTEPAQTPSAIIGTERVYFAHLPIQHKVLMRLMCDGVPRRTAILLALSSTPEKTMISWDSVKVAGGPSSSKMTSQERTVEHIDEYGARYGDRTHRIQAIINDDQDSAKLCFVPFTHDAQVRELICALLEKPDFFAQHGFKRISGENSHDLIEVLDEFAVAPPPLAMVLWETGVVHYEASTQPATRSGDVLPCFQSRKLRASDRRLRFVVGTHTPTLSDPVLQRLAVACVRGVVPDYNRHANRDCAPRVYENVMNGKTTQFLKPRIICDVERASMEHALSEQGATEMWNSLPTLYKHLYGVSQPFDSLGFSAIDALLLPHSVSSATSSSTTATAVRVSPVAQALSQLTTTTD